MTQVKLTTNFGNIVIELDDQTTPITVDNFLNYVDSGFYNGTIFHRLVKGFCLQGGGYDTQHNYKEPTNATIENESPKSKSNTKGTIAMARTMAPHSASTQFYFNLEDNSKHLDHVDQNGRVNWGYTVFGHVIKGWEAIEKVANNTTVGRQDIPTKLLIIEKAERV